METLLIGAFGASWAGWAYWKRKTRLKRRREDLLYWEKVRRECPSCGIRRAAQKSSPISSAG